MTETLRTEVKKVSLTAIRDELRALWASELFDEEMVVRARSHNLIVYTDKTRHNVDDLVEHIIAVNAHRPGRVVLIQYDPTVKEKLDAWVTVYCQPQGSHQVCSEMVVLEVGQDLRAEIHSTVIALLVPDLPVYLWSMQLPEAEDHFYQNVVEEADRLIIDSDFFPDLVEDLPALLQLEDILVSDLAWARLTPWRRHLAEFWDMPHLRDALAGVQRVLIRYVSSGTRADANRALLLAGWLADRLGWQLRNAEMERPGDYALTYQHSAGQIEVTIGRVELDGVPPGELAEVRLRAGSGADVLSPGLVFLPTHSCIEIEMNGLSQRDWAFRPVDAAAALAEELDYDYDPSYRAALKRAAEMVSAAHGA